MCIIQLISLSLQPFPRAVNGAVWVLAQPDQELLTHLPLSAGSSTFPQEVEDEKFSKLCL